SPNTLAGRSILFFARCAPSLAWCCWLWWHPGRLSMSKSNLWRRATWAIVLLVMTSLSGTGRTEPPSLSAAAKFVSIVLGAAGGLSEDNLALIMASATLYSPSYTLARSAGVAVRHPSRHAGGASRRWLTCPCARAGHA